MTWCYAKVTITWRHWFKNRFSMQNNRFFNRKIDSHEQRNAWIRTWDMHNLDWWTQQEDSRKFRVS